MNKFQFEIDKSVNVCGCLCMKNKIGFDKPLHEMEQKMHGTVCKKLQSPENADVIEIGDMVAVFVPFMNKWVRGQLKEKTSNGKFCIFAIDYGVPVVSKSVDVIKLPPAYVKMNMKCPRIQIGGMIDCVPADGVYNYETDHFDLNVTSNWSKKANDIVQKAINCAVQLKFDGIQEFKLMDRVHHFGQLKCQKTDGSWTDLKKCLSNALVAKITTDTDWYKIACQMESIRQPEWKTDEGIPLNINIAVVGQIPGQIKDDAEQNDVLNTTSNQPIDSKTSVENASSKNTQAIENGNSKTEAEQSITPNTARSYGSFQAGPQTRPFRMKNSRGFFPIRRGVPGNRWPNSRDRIHYSGRIPTQWDQEYFESCLGKPNKPNEKHEPSSASSSASEDDNENNKNGEPTINDNERKQKDSNKSDDTTNVHETTDEMKSVTEAIAAVAATATATADTAADVPMKGNDDKNSA